MLNLIFLQFAQKLSLIFSWHYLLFDQIGNVVCHDIHEMLFEILLPLGLGRLGRFELGFWIENSDKIIVVTWYFNVVDKFLHYAKVNIINSVVCIMCDCVSNLVCYKYYKYL